MNDRQNKWEMSERGRRKNNRIIKENELAWIKNQAEIVRIIEDYLEIRIGIKRRRGEKSGIMVL